MVNGKPFAVAGIRRAWQAVRGYTFSFCLLTINADSHPLLRRMHKPEDEKRSLVTCQGRIMMGGWDAGILSWREPT